MVHGRHLYMRRVEPHQRSFSQKTVQVTARLWLRLIWTGILFFPPIPSQSAPEASSSVFLTEDDFPPGYQFGAQQLVAPEYTSALSQPEGLRLPKVALPLPKMKMETAYDLLCLLRPYYCAHPTHAFSIPRRRWSSCHPSVTHGRLTKFHRLSNRGRFRSYR